MRSTVIYSGPQGAMVEAPGVVGSYWVQAWDLAMAQKLRAALLGVRERQPKGVATLMAFQVSGLDARAFADQPTLNVLGEMNVQFADYFRENSIVLEGGGFVAAALRSTAWALTQLVRGKQAPKYFESEGDAARHLARTHAELGFAESDVLAVMKQARASVTRG